MELIMDLYDFDRTSMTVLDISE